MTTLTDYPPGIDPRVDRTARALHWLIGLAIVGMIPLGLYFEELPESTDKMRIFFVHAGIGLVVLGLSVWRVARRIRVGLPSPLGSPSPRARRAARVVHGVLLAFTLYAPLTGLLVALGKGYPIAPFGLFTIHDGEPVPFLARLTGLHGAPLVLGLGLLTLGHALMAFKHQWVDRDWTLARMIRGPRVTRGQSGR